VSVGVGVGVIVLLLVAVGVLVSVRDDAGGIAKSSPPHAVKINARTRIMRLEVTHRFIVF